MIDLFDKFLFEGEKKLFGWWYWWLFVIELFGDGEGFEQLVVRSLQELISVKNFVYGCFIFG